MPLLKYDHDNFRKFFEYHRGCRVAVSSLGPPCMILVLNFYHPSKSSQEERKSELWCFPESIQLPALEWVSNLRITQPDPVQGNVVADEHAGVLIRCRPDTWMRLLVHDELDVPGLNLDETTE